MQPKWAPEAPRAAEQFHCCPAWWVPVHVSVLSSPAPQGWTHRLCRSTAPSHDCRAHQHCNEYYTKSSEWGWLIHLCVSQQASDFISLQDGFEIFIVHLPHLRVSQINLRNTLFLRNSPTCIAQAALICEFGYRQIVWKHNQMSLFCSAATSNLRSHFQLLLDLCWALG